MASEWTIRGKELMPDQLKQSLMVIRNRHKLKRTSRVKLLMYNNTETSPVTIE
jgi:hypothetical protein